MTVYQAEAGQTNLLEIANRQVELAKLGNFQAGSEIVIQGAIAIRDFLKGDPPDEYRLIFLKALLESLDAIQAGADPLDALSLRRPDHRPADISVQVRNVLLFTLVGAEVDRLTAKGQTHQDKPTDKAIRTVAKARKLTVDVVAKAWRNLGGAKGWERDKADWK